jgi:hypothetical protein
MTGRVNVNSRIRVRLSSNAASAFRLFAAVESSCPAALRHMTKYGQK